MNDIHWFLDAVPVDLGLNEKDIDDTNEDCYIIGGINATLEDITEIYTLLNLRKNLLGRKYINIEKHVKNVELANKVLNDFINSKKIRVLGTIFYHSQIPDEYRQNPELFVSSDNPREVGIMGMRGRAFSQTIYIMMEPIKTVPDINPIVCLDNEDPVIQDSVKYHIINQLANFKPDAKVKVQSIDLADKDEPKGYVVSDVICSILRNYIHSPNEYGVFDELINKIVKFDSKLRVVRREGIMLQGEFKTGAVTQWEWMAQNRN